jgi:hypothetical protein
MPCYHLNGLHDGGIGMAYCRYHYENYSDFRVGTSSAAEAPKDFRHITTITKLLQVDQLMIIQYRLEKENDPLREDPLTRTLNVSTRLV